MGMYISKRVIKICIIFFLFIFFISQQTFAEEKQYKTVVLKLPISQSVKNNGEIDDGMGKNEIDGWIYVKKSSIIDGEIRFDKKSKVNQITSNPIGFPAIDYIVSPIGSILYRSKIDFNYHFIKPDGSGDKIIFKTDHDTAKLADYNKTIFFDTGKNIVFLGEHAQSGFLVLFRYYDIYVINYDGTGLKKLYSDALDLLAVGDGKIYFYVDTTDTNDVYSMNYNGTSIKKICENVEYAERAQISGKYLVITCYDQEVIYSMTTGRTIKIAVGSLNHIGVTADKIVLSADPNNPNGKYISGLFYVTFNGKTKKQITSDNITSAVVGDNSIYYIRKEDDSLYSIRADGTSKKKIGKIGNSISLSHVSGGRIYYSGRSDENDEYDSIKLNGTDRKVHNYTDYRAAALTSWNLMAPYRWEYVYKSTHSYIRINTSEPTRQQTVIPVIEGKNYIFTKDGIFHTNDKGNTVYRLNPDGTGNTELFSTISSISDFRVFDGIVYYVTSVKEKEYKMCRFINGKEQVLIDHLPDSTLPKMSSVNGWVYYMGSDKKVYTISENAGEPSLFSASAIKNWWIDSRNVYYEVLNPGIWKASEVDAMNNVVYKSMNDSMIYKINETSAIVSENNDVLQIADNKTSPLPVSYFENTGRIADPVTGVEYDLFYAGTDTVAGFLLDLSSGNTSSMMDDISQILGVRKGWIFYNDLKNGLYRVKMDGSGRSRLINTEGTRIYNIQFAGNFILFDKPGKNNVLINTYMIKQDGTGFMKVSQ